MRARPLIQCMAARTGLNGLPLDIKVITLEDVPEHITSGWAIVGPDPEDEIAFNLWLREANAQFSVGYDPGDEAES